MENSESYKKVEYSEEAQVYKNRLNKLNLSGDVEHSIELMDDIALKARELEDKYGPSEIRRYELFHVLIGSGLMAGGEIVALDLPNNEISEIISELENKYGSV